MEKTIRKKSQRGYLVEILRKMEVGDVLKFPVAEYNYDSIRATVSSGLVPERCEGKSWRTNLNVSEKCVNVTRLS